MRFHHHGSKWFFGGKADRRKRLYILISLTKGKREKDFISLKVRSFQKTRMTENTKVDRQKKTLFYPGVTKSWITYRMLKEGGGGFGSKVQTRRGRGQSGG